MEKKFVASTVEVNADTDILVEDISAKRVSLAWCLDEGHRIPGVVHIVDENKDLAETVAARLNEEFMVDLGTVALAKQMDDEHARSVAYGSDKRLEAVSAEDTAKAAIENVMNNSTKTQKEMVEMTNKTNKGVAGEMNVKGVSDKEAVNSTAAQRFLNARSAGAKNAQKPTTKKEEKSVDSQIKRRIAGAAADQTQGTQKEEKEMNKTAEGVTRRFKGAGAGTAANGQGQTKSQETKGGNEMKTQSKGNKGVKGQGTTRRFAGSAAGAPEGKAAVTRSANQRLDWDDSVRETEAATKNTTPWYLRTENYKSLERLPEIIATRKDADLGIEAINLLNPNDPKVVQFENHNYLMVVEVVFGGGLNIRFRVSANTNEESTSDLKSSNIAWKQFGRDLTPVYSFARPNNTTLRVKCSCSTSKRAKFVDVYEGSNRPSKCECGKKYSATGEFAVTVDGKPVAGKDITLGDWARQELDNFNIQIHKDVLAVAMAFAQYAWGLPMHGLVADAE